MRYWLCFRNKVLDFLEMEEGTFPLSYKFKDQEDGFL